MNRLVRALLAQPSVVGQVIRDETAPFAVLRDVLGDALFSESEWEAVARDEIAFQAFRTSYLPTVSASDWYAALRQADEMNPDSRSVWWTVMIPSDVGDFGLTAPENSSETELVALFSGPLSGARVFAYDLMRTSPITLPFAHCSPPSWGICAPGSCGGCKARLVWDPTTKSKGIECRCPDPVV
jgi:hypothetical protein